jgi:hypothetical protein
MWPVRQGRVADEISLLDGAQPAGGFSMAIFRNAGPQSPEPEPACQTTGSVMTRDELMKRLSADPRIQIVKPSGKGFVIGGAKPSTKA